MLRDCVLDFGGSWEEHLYVAEFVYNKSYQASIRMPPFEELYDKKCQLPLCWDDVGEKALIGLDLVAQLVEKIRVIQNRLRVVQDREEKCANM